MLEQAPKPSQPEEQFIHSHYIAREHGQRHPLEIVPEGE